MNHASGKVTPEDAEAVRRRRLDPLVSPAVVLGGEPLDERGDLGADRRPSRPVRSADAGDRTEWQLPARAKSESTAEIGRIPSSIGTPSPLVSLQAIP